MDSPALAALAEALHRALPGRDLTCDLSDALGQAEPPQVGALPPGFRPLHAGRPFAGLAVTAQPQDTELGAVYAALEQAPAGSVLVVAGAATHAFWGERTTRAAQARGVRAAVLAGACRDVNAVRHLGFPVVCTGVTPGAGPRRAGGVIQLPVTLGGVGVRPGDLVVGDDSGVVVVPAARALQLVPALLRDLPPAFLSAPSRPDRSSP